MLTFCLILMFSDLLENLFSSDEQIITSTGQLIAQFRDENPDQYIQELINIISEESNEQNSIQPKIQQASIVLLRQVITSTTDDEKFTSSFFEQLMTLLLPKMSSENYNLAHSSAVLFGESLSFLVRDKNHSDAFSQLIETLNSEINTVSSNTENPELKNLKFLLISIKSFAESTDLETDQIIPLFQALHQLYQTDYLTNEVLQAIIAMIDEIADTFNQFSQLLSSQNSENNECKLFIDQLFSFFSQLLEKASINEGNKVVCYDFFRLFFKNVTYSFFHENINKVLELVMSDISTSTNESVLLSSIHFLKTTIRREWKMKNRSHIQFSPFYNFSHFDSFIMPLIRVFAMIPDDDTNLDSDYIEYQNPHIAAQEMISIFVYTFPEHSSKILIPLIQCLSPENCNLEESIKTTFSCFDAQFEMNSFIAIETSLFLLCLITQFSTNLPSYDFIISFIGMTLSSSSVRIRFASVRALDSYFNHCFGKNQSTNDETEKDDEDSNELSDIKKALALLVPEILKHVIDEHPIISCYSMKLISKYSSFSPKYDAFPSEIIFPLFLKVIESHSDLNVIDDAFNYLEKIIKNRKMEEVFALIEPVIQLLGDSNQQESNSDYNESLRALIIVILQEVTVAALPYYEVIYSLLVDHIEPHLLNYLSIISILFDRDFPHNFQQTFEIIFEFLSNSETVTEDRPLRNKIVSECCFSILIIAKSDLFEENIEKTSSLLLSLLSKDNSNLNTLIGISAICLYQGEKIKETLPTFYQIVSQINIIELSENLCNEESNEIDDNINFDDIVSSCVNILMACYKVEKNNQEITKLIIDTLQSIISIGHKIPTLLEMAFDLILYLDNSLFTEIEDIATDLIKVSTEFDDLKSCIEELRAKIKICYDGSNSHFEYEEDEEEEENE